MTKTEAFGSSWALSQPNLFGYVDIPYDLLKQAVERIEKKKGICRLLPGARFAFSQADTVGKTIRISKGCPNSYAIIKLDCLVCNDQMGGESTGTSAESCKNCIRKYCKHLNTVRRKCDLKDECKKMHEYCKDCGMITRE